MLCLWKNDGSAVDGITFKYKAVRQKILRDKFRGIILIFPKVMKQIKKTDFDSVNLDSR